MTDKELSKLSRKELLELLIAQTVEMDKLQERLDNAEKKLSDRDIAINESGSIAEAALKLNGVFEACQSAANQYLESLRQNGAVSEEVSANIGRSTDAINNMEMHSQQSDLNIDVNNNTNNIEETHFTDRVDHADPDIKMSVDRSRHVSWRSDDRLGLKKHLSLHKDNKSFKEFMEMMDPKNLASTAKLVSESEFAKETKESIGRMNNSLQSKIKEKMHEPRK